MDLRLQLRLRQDQRGVPHLKAQPPRPVISVACGVLVDAAGEVLIAQRPEGKIAAGKWEFPGGKIERGETPYQALVRELREELGIEVTAARRLIRFRHEYADRVVLLDTWLVYGFDGQPRAQERQQFAWLHPDQLHTLDGLPTVAPIAQALRLPLNYVFTPPNADEALVRAGLARLPPGSLLRLRVPALDDEAYGGLAARLLPAVHGAGLRLLLDRQPRQVTEIGADGWHATERALLHSRQRPLPRPLLLAASVHDARGVEAARRLGADCVVLGPVLPTASHPQAQGLGWPAFEQLVEDLPLPAYAIGGVGPRYLDLAHAHGAQGIAGIRAYWSV